MSYEPAWDREARWEERNLGTVCGDPYRLEHPRLPAAELFNQHFSAIWILRQAHAIDGYLVVPVFDHSTLGPYAHVPDSADRRVSTLVVGRHTRATMHLDRDATVALRHLVVRVRAGELGQPTIRLIDLNTNQGFEIDGLGSCETAICDGPLVVRLGGYTLFLLPTTCDQEPWPTSPEAVWRNTTQTVVTDLRKRAQRPFPRLVGRRETSLVLLPGPVPVSPQALAVAGGPLVGRLILRDEGQVLERAVHRDELERGLLIGRYERCALHPAAHEEESPLSRVHVLLTAEGRDVVAVDTASTNGSILDDSPFDVTALPDCARLELGATMTVDWIRAGCKPRVVPEANPSHPGPAGPGPFGDSPAATPTPVATAAASPRHLRFPQSPVARSFIMGAAGGVAVAILRLILSHGHAAHPAPEPPPRQQCINPSELFGTDSPELRLYLYDRVPGVCFDRKWQPPRQSDADEDD